MTSNQRVDAARRRPPHPRRPARARCAPTPTAACAPTPKDIPPKWFYDDRGSQLFDDITRLPEYYPTRCERAILVERARRDRGGHRRRHARRARLGHLRQDAHPARRAARRGHDHALRSVRRERADAARRGRGGEPRLPDRARARGRRRLRAPPRHRSPAAAAGWSRSSAARSATSLPPRRAEFLLEIAQGLGPDDHLLLGLDLVKDIDRLEAAYDDSQGVTAEFNKNVLAVMNRELDADFDAARFEHVAVFEKDQRADRDAPARASTRTPCTCARSTLDVPFAAGEEMRTEVSAKFTREQVVERARARRACSSRAGGPTPTATSRCCSRARYGRGR